MVRGDMWLYGPRLERRSTLEQRHTIYHEYFHTGDLEQAGGARAIAGTGAAYVVGPVAIDYLVKKYGREPLQSNFWTALAETDWRSGFLQVFGIPVDTFYSEFATYRQTLPP